MKSLLANIKITVDEKVYLKDPESSVKGQQIIQTSILLIDELGLESFTFKKLAERIGTTEATIYRYFESKHTLLVYLISWYWNWLEYRLVFATSNIASAEDRLKIAIHILSGKIENDANFAHISEVALQRIVIAESAKAYLTKEVDTDNKHGFFLSYKRLCKRISNIIQEINPDYKYPDSLVSTVAESAHYQIFFSQHLPSLTNINDSKQSQLEEFLTDLVFKAIEK
ncbi:TetR/AcrR family transcriptional regulator [Pontibacter cellulosilyticus]|uniref:TetR/AcrR family transcriptional regulator n=1 Tax=Pontibacter cellulosilyticus TaxID=1720253 RepID=A0A923NBU4_9BACT|nr:TetR/AcrR family transcriptional regulator [Pontibacter cellulosilyticus]MBC5995041.1 TetR/AcrR family transcriptional regulator [Pontibacter cellulosilyticus]